jgi:hypothetical protein
VEATLISISRPLLVYNTPSTLKVMSESRRLTMARVRAPRAATMSTVRLVSVVVPDWLMATTRVSPCSGCRPLVQFEPAEFRGLEGAHLDGGIGQVIGLEDVGAGLGGHAGGTLAHEKDAPDAVLGEAASREAGKAARRDGSHGAAVAAVGNFPAVEQGALHR